MPATTEGSQAALFGREGELVTIRVSVEPRLLEDLLEILAGLDFPINPELGHRVGSVRVDFPAYAGDVAKVRESLARYGFEGGALQVYPMLRPIAS